MPFLALFVLPVQPQNAAGLLESIPSQERVASNDLVQRAKPLSGQHFHSISEPHSGHWKLLASTLTHAPSFILMYITSAYIFLTGWDTGIRTPTIGAKNQRATITPYPNGWKGRIRTSMVGLSPYHHPGNNRARLPISPPPINIGPLIIISFVFYILFSYFFTGF